MPVFKLSKEIIFPHPSLANEDGLLAVGGDLSTERIITAYLNGIFPWYNEDEPILWWSPNPRCVLFPNKFKPSKSLLSIIKKNVFEVRFDAIFKTVIEKCATTKRKGEPGSWITTDIKKAYIKLHKLGFAHSVETYKDNELVGGLYGIAIGSVFYGESMFHSIPNASKVAFYFLIEKLKQLNFEIIDNQMTTPHLLSMGAEEISREKFLEILKKEVKLDLNKSPWPH
jgi:leucyl/phenylalanyl-tRNA--protein transferase